MQGHCRRDLEETFAGESEAELVQFVGLEKDEQ